MHDLNLIMGKQSGKPTVRDIYIKWIKYSN